MSLTSLVQNLCSSGYLETPAIIDAFCDIDRADFVPAALKDKAYFDSALPIGHKQTISQPLTVAFMLEHLQPKKDEKILDVGSGSGWTTALLAHIVGKNGMVFGLERVPELVDFGRHNLAKYHLPQAEILQAGDKLGLPDKALFDRILVSASGKKLPEELIDQLRIGGRLIVPVRDSILQVDKISSGKFKKQVFPGFVFVPLQYTS